jgi:hypothetical protein
VGQVVGDLDALEGEGQAGRFQEIGGHDPRVREAVRELPDMSAGERQLMTTLPHEGHESSADVTAGPDHEDPHHASMWPRNGGPPGGSQTRESMPRDGAPRH